MALPPSPLQIRDTDAPGLSKGLLTPLNTFFRQVQTALAGGLTFSQNSTSRIVTVDVTVVPLWTFPPLSGTWVATAVGREARYCKRQDGEVRIEGSISSGTINTTAFTLPTGYLPYQDFMAYAVNTSTTGTLGFGTLQIKADGTVLPRQGGVTEFDFGSTSFLAKDLTPIPNIVANTFQTSLKGVCTGMSVLQAVQKGVSGLSLHSVTGLPTFEDNGDKTVTIFNVPGLPQNPTASSTWTLTLLAICEPT